MKESKTELPLLLLLVIKVALLLRLTDGQYMDLHESAAQEQTTIEIRQEGNDDEGELKQEETTTTLEGVSFLDNILKTSQKRGKSFPKFLSYYKRNVFPQKFNATIAHALDQHIEGMEPQFRSASFQQLWHALKGPLTDVMRPRKVECLLSDLEKCKLGDEVQPYTYPSDIESIKRDLAICKIGEVLDENAESSKTKTSKRSSYAQLWRLLKHPLTGTFKIAELSLLMNDLGQCLPRFALAGIQYEVPSKMSEVKRDVVICKVDDVFNEAYRNGDGQDGSGSGEDTSSGFSGL